MPDRREVLFLDIPLYRTYQELRGIGPSSIVTKTLISVVGAFADRTDGLVGLARHGGPTPAC
jgi:hypothetical protein